MASTKATNVSLNSFEMLGVYFVYAAFVLLVAFAVCFIVYGVGYFAMESASDAIYQSTGVLIDVAPLAEGVAFITFACFFGVLQMRKR